MSDPYHVAALVLVLIGLALFVWAAVHDIRNREED